MHLISDILSIRLNLAPNNPLIPAPTYTNYNTQTSFIIHPHQQHSFTMKKATICVILGLSTLVAAHPPHFAGRPDFESSGEESFFPEHKDESEGPMRGHHEGHFGGFGGGQQKRWAWWSKRSARRSGRQLWQL